MECQISAAPQDNDHMDQPGGIEARAKPKQGRLGVAVLVGLASSVGVGVLGKVGLGVGVGVTGVSVGVMVATPIN